MSKLYTEEQVSNAIKLAKKCESDCGGVYFDYEKTSEIIEELTPIELPTDEEIDDVALDTFLNGSKRFGFIEGAKWMRDKIKGGQGE